MNFHINSIESFSAHPDGHSCLEWPFLPCSECRCKSSQQQRAASRLFCATLLRTMATSARSDAAWEYRA